MLAVKDCLNFFPREDLLCDAELLFVDFYSKTNKMFTVEVFYKPPNSNLKPLQELQNTLGKISTPELVLIRDFN